jgi:DNA-binding PadR family transcriptional regulator
VHCVAYQSGRGANLLENKKEIDNVLKNLKERIIKDFLDVIVLCELQNGSLSGYDIISVVFRRYHFLISAGTVYSQLYKLERKGLIECSLCEKKKIYCLTSRGKFTIGTIMKEPFMKFSAESFRKTYDPTFFGKAAT